jgi:hypothetical protein
MARRPTDLSGHWREVPAGDERRPGSRRRERFDQRLSTLLNTTKMFDRGNGVMLLPEPCMVFESNTRAAPAAPVNWSIPCSAANRVRSASLGTPISCDFSDAL